MGLDQTSDIIIDNVQGGDGDGDDLLECYFVYDPTSQTYTFFEQNGEQLATGLQVGQKFRFQLSDVPGITWILHISKHSTATLVTGKWKSKPSSMDISGDDWEPDQSYQAQAGGNVDDVKATASNA